HEGDGACRQRAAETGPGAHRGDAAVRRPDAGADGRHCACRRLGARAPAPRAPRGAHRRDRAADRRPRSRRPVQRPDPPACVRARAEPHGQGGDRALARGGKKGNSTLRFRGYKLSQAWSGFSDRPAYSDAKAIANRLADLYVSREVDRAVVVYNHFVSPLVQTGVEQDVLPIPAGELRREGEEREAALLGDVIYEPEPEEILARLLPFYLETEIYRALLESAASEQGARMTAMRNASKNAGELIDTLTLAMNRARQAEIT